MNDICELTEAELDLVVGGLATEGGSGMYFCWLSCYQQEGGGKSYGSWDLTGDIFITLAAAG